MTDTQNPLDQLRTLLHEQKDTEQIEEIFQRIDEGAQISVTEVRIPSDPILAFIEGVRFVIDQLLGDFPDTSFITSKDYDDLTSEDWFNLTDVLMNHVQAVNYTAYETVRQILQEHLKLRSEEADAQDQA